ncbi:MAG: cytochrome c [Nibricoccus sp.]
MSRLLPIHTLFLIVLIGSVALPASAAGAGAELFVENCVRCHGEDGRGHTKMGRKLKIVDLTSATLQARLTPERVFDSITNGKPDARGNERMPAFGEKLSEADRRLLANYVKTFDPGKSGGTDSK